jgi:hypothetical protein
VVDVHDQIARRERGRLGDEVGRALLLARARQAVAPGCRSRRSPPGRRSRSPTPAAGSRGAAWCASGCGPPARSARPGSS